jgi:hypothetical protein
VKGRDNDFVVETVDVGAVEFLSEDFNGQVNGAINCHSVKKEKLRTLL